MRSLPNQHEDTCLPSFHLDPSWFTLVYRGFPFVCILDSVGLYQTLFTVLLGMLLCWLHTLLQVIQQKQGLLQSIDI